MNTVSLELRAIFWEALDHPSGAERREYLDRACGADSGLRSRVEALLLADRDAGDFLEDPVSAPTLIFNSPTPLEAPGTSIGPYKLMEQIGEGGMGVVYVAEQTHPVRRKVALKVIKPGMDSKQVIARFEAERQALAVMDHLNIAKVHDGGTTESGRPYFVMELVRGLPITDYCDGERLSIRQRLELFVLVCRAVQHAHQKGIIHRDLKPSNILVTLHDGVPVPKVIDFGVAKATGHALTEKTVYTAFTQLVGTPLYMSPEQIELSGLDIDTRSDIYSLGVLLYELLTGTTPFGSETLNRAAFDEMRRIIREEDPPTPSTRLSVLGETLTATSMKRASDPRHLNRSVRGELDWIVMKALEKDRRRRYETANDFAADVLRHLSDRPVEACPPSPWYRFGKFARRNRVSLTTTALVATALIAGTAVSLWQAHRAARAAGEAERQANESRQVVDYLVTDVFAAAAPGKGRGRSVTVGELLDQADATLSNRFRRQPLVEASVRMALAQSCRLQVDLERAERHAVRATELRSRLLGPEHPETLQALQEHALILIHGGWTSPSKWETSVTIARRVLAARRRVLGPNHPEVVDIQTILAYSLNWLGRADEAQDEATQAEALALRVLGSDHAATLGVWDVLGQIAARRGDRERGEALLRRVVEGREHLLGALDPNTINALGNLADIVSDQGRLDEARPLYLESVDRLKRYYGISHIQVSSRLGGLFSVLRRQRDSVAIRDFCESWLREILATPAEPDDFEKSRRQIRLCSLAYPLGALPDPVPFDAELAVRVAEEVGGAAAGILYYRLGRLDKSEEAIQLALQGPGANFGWRWMIRALLHARRGDRRQAREFSDRAVKWMSEQKIPFSAEAFESIRAETEALLVSQEPPGESGPSRSPKSKSPRK